MTGAEKIRDKILEEAWLQAKDHMERARKEAEGILKVAQEKCDEQKRMIEEKARKEAADRKRRNASISELEGRKKKLAAKQEMVELVFRKAIEKLNTMPDQQYREILTDMVANTVKDGTEELILSQRDRMRLGSDFIDALNRRIASLGKDFQVRLSEEIRDINGGFILKKGSIEVNQSFDAILRMQRNEFEAEVVKILF